MFAMRTPPREIRREKISFASRAAAITFIRSQPAVFGTISLDICAVLLGFAIALMPIYAPDQMRGSVTAVSMLFIDMSNQLGDFEAGAVAGLIGPVAAVVFRGAGIVAMAALWTRMFLRLRRLDAVYDS